MYSSRNICPYCREEIKEGAIVCRFCGRNLPNSLSPIHPVLTQQKRTKPCSYCAEDINVKAKVCRHCGRDLPSSPPWLAPLTQPVNLREPISSKDRPIDVIKGPQPITQSYKLPRIRDLLTEGFSYEELRRFCYDNPDFRKVYHQLSSEMGQDKVIDRIIQHAEQTSKFETLLSWAKKDNPTRYKEFSPYQDEITISGTTFSFYEEPQRVKLSPEQKELLIPRQMIEEWTQEVKLSPEQKELLIAAAQKGEFYLISTQETSTWVRVGGKNFHDDNDPAVAVKFLEAFRELYKDGYITKESGIYTLTSSGFKIARRLAGIK